MERAVPKRQPAVQLTRFPQCVTRMLRTKFPQEVDFDVKRVGVNAAGLLIGTIETTAQASAQTIQFLLDHTELLIQAQNSAAGDDPAVFDSIVWGGSAKRTRLIGPSERSLQVESFCGSGTHVASRTNAPKTCCWLANLSSAR